MNQTLWLPPPFPPILGLDEAGRGCWAGSVVAGAVWFFQKPPERLLSKLNDSKKLSSIQRGQLVPFIQEHSFWGIGEASAQEIDEMNILQASFLAMERAQQHLFEQFNTQIFERGFDSHLKQGTFHLDGNRLPKKNWRTHWTFKAIPKGDALELPIAAASVLAKEYRDEQMKVLDQTYPEYGFAAHKSYGTAQHQKALQQWGPCPEHRKTFKPIKNLINLKS